MGPPLGSGKGDREAQYQRQLEKRRLARQAAALAAAGKPIRERRGRPQGPQTRRCSNSTDGLPAKRPQCQKTAWMRRKQPPLGMTAWRAACCFTVTASGNGRGQRQSTCADEQHKQTRQEQQQQHNNILPSCISNIHAIINSSSNHDNSNTHLIQIHRTAYTQTRQETMRVLPPT